MDINQHTDIQAIVDGFMAARHAKHLDFRMDATETPAPAPEGGAEGTGGASGTGGTPEGGEGAPKGTEGEGEPKPSPEDELPEWARTELKKVRGEAAGYRTRLRDAETKLAEAKTPEDVETAVAEIKAQNAALERSLTVSKVATKHQLPDELAALLQGDDEAAIETHAKALAKFAVTTTAPESLSGGLTPGGESDEVFDPVAVAKAARQRRY